MVREGCGILSSVVWHLNRFSHSLLFISKWEHCLFGLIVSDMNLIIIVGATASIYLVIIMFVNEQKFFKMTLILFITNEIEAVISIL